MIHSESLLFQGGMKAVIWADAFQAFVMIGGMLAVIILVISKII